MNTNIVRYSHPFQLFQCIQRPLRLMAFIWGTLILIRIIDYFVMCGFFSSSIILAIIIYCLDCMKRHLIEGQSLLYTFAVAVSTM